MIDLSRPLALFKGDPVKKQHSAPAKASVAAIVLEKNDPKLVEKTQELAKAQGLELAHLHTFEDGTVALATDAEFENGAQVVRLSDKTALMVKGLQPYMAGVEFAAAAEERGFYNGLRSATESGMATVLSLVSKGESPKEFLAGYQAYVAAMTEALPITVLKLEGELIEATAAFQAEEPKVEGEEPKPEDVAKEDDKPAEGTDKTDETPAAGEAVAEPAAEVAKNDEPKADPAITDLIAAVSKLTESLATMTQKVDAVAASVTAVEGKIVEVQGATEQKLAEVARKAETATRAVTGAVVASDIAGDPEPQPVVRKRDGDLRTGVFDSAMFPRIR